MDKKNIIICILAVLFLGQTCSKCSSNRRSEFANRENTAKLDSITYIKDSLFLQTKEYEKKIEILKKDNFDIKVINEMLVESNKNLKNDKANLNADKKTLNKIINDK